MIGVGSIDWFRRPLPPNRTCGSPASGSPVGGFTRKGTDGPKDGCLLQAQRLPFGRSVSIRVVRSGDSPCSHPCQGTLRHSYPRGQCCRYRSAWIGLHVSTFLHPLAPPALPGFIATMGALTPARRRDSQARSAPRGGRYLESFLLLRRAGLLASRVPSLQSLPSPTTQLPPMTALTPNPSASWASCSHRYRLRLSLAGSPVSMAESSLLSLRTTLFAFHCSPPRLTATQLRLATGRSRFT
jgi:hypothetical protein